MAPVNSILSLVNQQGANELRLGSDREPQMFADGAQKRLVIPKTSTDTLRDLLGEILSKDRESQLAEQGQALFTYEAPDIGLFRVTLTRRGSPGGPLAFDALFVRERGKASPPPAPKASAQVAASAPEPFQAPMIRSEVPPATSAASPGASEEEPRSLEPPRELVGLLTRAAAQRASDVHLLEGELPVIRVDGRLQPLTTEPPASLGRLLGPGLVAEARRRMASGSSADLGLGIEGVGRLRLNVFQTSEGLCAAIRVLRAAPPELAELGAPIPLDFVSALPNGLVILCGPTGSGKSSTLAAIAQDAVQKRPSLLITLEDPIEYTHSSRARRGLVRQRQIGRDVRDFATGLRDALREDPDILLVGEMRDPETISLALTAAETGHLVLTSLHCRSAAGAIERIVDTYPAERQQQVRVQLADSLRAVIAQRLLPRAGFEGRVLAMEVLRGTHAVASAIRDQKSASIQSAIQAGRKDGMLPLERCLADLVQKRQVTLDDARAVANDAAVLTSYLSG